MKVLILFFVLTGFVNASELEVSIEKLKDGRVVKVTTEKQYEFLDTADLDSQIAERQVVKAEIVSAKPASQETEDLVK